MKAWEREYKVLHSGVPCYEEDDNETIWEEEAGGPEAAQDALARMYWRSQVPGSRAYESIANASVQAIENRGYIVENSEELIERGLKALEEDDIVKLHKCTQDVFQAVYHAKKDESSPYWDQTFYDTFEDLEKAVKFPEKVEIPVDDDYFRRTYAGWLCQIIGGAYGTCIEGYTGENIKKKYGEVDRYIRKPNTYNDDITYEIALLFAYGEYGKNTTALEIANEWMARIPMGWSAEDFALRNLKAGILPPESGRFHNPFNEWIGAQMRGAVCGQIYPGDVYNAAKAAFMDASISHDHNGILGEVFNAAMVAMSYYEKDVRKIIEACIELMPEDSEYGQVVRYAYQQCLIHDDYYSAWMPCENRYKKYNWIHVYPNAAAQVIALYYGEGDFVKTLTYIGGCGQDVDCNAAQILTVIGTIHGLDCVPSYWRDPIGDNLDTYVRGYKKTTITELTKLTAKVAELLK